MRKMRFGFIIAMLIFSVHIFAGVPIKIEMALKKIYPKALNPDWTLKDNYYVAGFILNGFQKDVWFDSNANWVMTQTDLETMDEVPSAVYNAFGFGQYSSWPVNNVICVEYPKCPTVIVIKVGEYNMSATYLLFYSLQGTLLNAYNADYLNGILWPEIFDCQ